MRELALSKRIPFIWLLDSAGARIQEADGSLFAGSGHLFREEVRGAEAFFAVMAALGGTSLFRTHEVERVAPVLEAMQWDAPA